MKTENEAFLKAAVNIGLKIIEKRVDIKDTCSWEIVSHDDQKKPLYKLASGNIYNGTAGIAMFLGRLYEITGNDIFANYAQKAICYSMKTTNSMQINNIGFYDGQIGIAYSTVKLASILNDSNYYNKSEEILNKYLENEPSHYNYDIISGLPGLIRRLIEISELLNTDKYQLFAIKLGEYLLKNAKKELTGCSWGKSSIASIRNMLGFAHGASGVGYSLMELYHVTGDVKFLFGAEQAFTYENQFLNAELYNWPDFRYFETSDLYLSKRYDELRELIITDSLSPYQEKYMSAWCHGAPGIVLSRMHAYRITCDNKYLNEIKGALENVKESIVQTWSNFSLCHGIAGNCEPLIEGSRVLKDPELFEIAEQCGKKALSMYNDHYSWPCGTLNKLSDPSLLVGEAGMGYFFLRLYSSEIPSILILSNNHYSAQNDNGNRSKNYNKLIETSINDNFPKILKIIYTLTGVDLLSDYFANDINHYENMIGKMYYRLIRFIEDQPEPTKKYLLDAFLPERNLYELLISEYDNTVDFINDFKTLAKDDPKESDIYSLSPKVKIINTNYDWDGWLLNSENNLPAQKQMNWIISIYQGKLLVKEISRFITLLLKAFQEPKTIQEAACEIKSHFNDDIIQSVFISESINSQIKLAIQGHVLEKIDGSYFPYALLPHNIRNDGNMKLSSFKRSHFALLGIILNAKSIVNIPDRLFKLFQMDNIINEIHKCLTNLHIIQYFVPYIENYIDSKHDEEKYMIFDLLIAELENTFPDYRKFTYIEQ